MAQLAATRPSYTRRRSAQRWLIFLAVFLILGKSKVITSYDSHWSIYVARSLAVRGDFDLDEYAALIPKDDYRVLDVDGHQVSSYPIGPALMATPVLVVISSVSRHLFGIPFEYYLHAFPSETVERTISCFFLALAAVLFFEATRRWTTGWRPWLLTFVLVFCTPVWSCISRGLWQQSPMLLLLCLALLLAAPRRPTTPANQSPSSSLGPSGPDAAILAEAGWSRLLALGATLGATYWMRPTGLLLLVGFLAWLALKRQRAVVPYLAGATVVCIVFTLLDFQVYGHFLQQYFTPRSDHFSLASLPIGGLGTLFSPGRGLFIYSPVFLFSLLGIVLKWRRRSFGSFDAMLLTCIVLQWLVASAWFSWWGGFSYGPRLLAESTPLLTYFLIPVLETPRVHLVPRVLLSAGLTLALLLSFMLHKIGATEKGPWQWNGSPISVDQDPSRLWDWADPPFLRRAMPSAAQPPSEAGHQDS